LHEPSYCGYTEEGYTVCLIVFANADLLGFALLHHPLDLTKLWKHEMKQLDKVAVTIEGDGGTHMIAPEQF